MDEHNNEMMDNWLAFQARQAHKAEQHARVDHYRAQVLAQEAKDRADFIELQRSRRYGATKADYGWIAAAVAIVLAAFAARFYDVLNIFIGG